MKFDELSILKYGGLSDLKPITFTSNINVLLGDNGTGKSSIVKSLYHMLFGIPTKQSEYFQYDYDGPTAIGRNEIGASGVILKIINGDEKLTISRSKWDKNVNNQIKDIFPQIDDVEKLRRLFSNFFFTSTKMIADIQGSISLDKNIRTDLIKLISLASGSGSQNIEKAMLSYAEYATTLTDKTESATRTKNLTKIGELQSRLKDVTERLKNIQSIEKQNVDNLSENDEESINELKKLLIDVDSNISTLQTKKQELQIQQKYIENIDDLKSTLNPIQQKNITPNSYKTYKLTKITSDFENLNKALSDLEIAKENIEELTSSLGDIKEAIGGNKKTTLQEVDVDIYIDAFDRYKTDSEKIEEQNTKVEEINSTLAEIEGEVLLQQSSISHYKKNKLKASDVKKLQTIAKKANEFDLDTLKEQISDLEEEIRSKEDDVKALKKECGFSMQSIAHIAKEKITVKEKSTLKKINKDFLKLNTLLKELDNQIKNFEKNQFNEELSNDIGEDIFSITEIIEKVLLENKDILEKFKKSDHNEKQLDSLIKQILDNENTVIKKVDLLKKDYESLIDNMQIKLQHQSSLEQYNKALDKQKQTNKTLKIVLSDNETILKKFKFNKKDLEDEYFSDYFEELENLNKSTKQLSELIEGKNKLLSELKTKEEAFKKVNLELTEIVKKYKLSKEFLKSSELDIQLELVSDLYEFSFSLNKKNAELKEIQRDQKSSLSDLVKLLKQINVDEKIEEITEELIEIFVNDFNNSVNKLIENYKTKDLIEGDIKKNNEKIKESNGVITKILKIYDAESADDIENLVILLNQFAVLFNDNDLNFLDKTEKEKFVSQILKDELMKDVLVSNLLEVNKQLDDLNTEQSDNKLELVRLENKLFKEPDYEKEDLLSDRHKILREWLDTKNQYLSTVLALYLVDEQLKNSTQITLDLKNTINNIIKTINPKLAGVEFDDEDDILSVKYKVSKENTREKDLHLHSDGEQAAIALAIRMAVQLETFKNSDFRFPLTYDDISDHLDRNSQDGFIKILEELSKETQILVLTHDEVFANAIIKSCSDANLINLNQV